MRRRSPSLATAAILLLAAVPSWATVIYVSGDQTGTWAADTVIVTAEVRVPPGQILTIQPGVEVLFSVYCKFIVDSAATLRAVGTAVDSIRFDVLPPGTAWHGIRFLSALDSCRLEYCLLTHGHATGSGEEAKGGAIYCSSSSPTISHNTINENSAAGPGGGIYCYNSSPNLGNNTISGNSAAGLGGGIYCTDSSPMISDNTISGNLGSYGGGIFCAYIPSPTISSNTISGNSAFGGGGICCWDSSPTISGNTMSRNSALSGGGIYCSEGRPAISGNTITGNSVNYGAGIYCYYSDAAISNNTISGNSAAYYGGGIDCLNGSPIIRGNTLGSNRAGNGGGIYCDNSSLMLVNCILWGNSPQQIFVSSGSPQVNYSDIQGGCTGTGNINAWPAFVDTAQGDYRLQWGSPCIDSGDPNPIYNDPDGTRADMGAWYYDQSRPVRILLTPYNAPIQIPASGGSFQYAIQATNIESAALSALVWCDATLPSGAGTAPLLGPVTISLTAGQTLSRLRTQAVPAGAPAGIYHYNAYAVAAGDTSEDSFTFTKLGAGGFGLGAGGWTNTGEGFGDVESAPQEGALLCAPTLYGARPNPFNPTTAVSYKLQAASHLSLRIFDTAGRLVTELVNGWREAGEHQTTFDGSRLPSGIYFARLTAGDYSQVQKLILLK